jgi:hypothetical protein
MALCVLWGVLVAYAGSYDVCELPGVSEYTPAAPVVTQTGDSKAYNGRLTIFIVEKVSRRYNDYSGNPYNHAFMGYGFDANFNLNDGDSINTTFSWSDAGFNGVDSTNLMAIAIIKDMSHGYTAYSDTGGLHNYPFTAYYTEACASATIDEVIPNVVNDNWSHSVFAEIGTATWCPSCPTMNSNMHIIDQFYDFPFNYCEMVTDLNGDASARMNDLFSLHWLPSTYYDDGYNVVIGGHGIGTIAAMIDNCGQRATTSWGLTLDFHSTAKGTYGGSVSLRENTAPTPPGTPTGVTEGAVDVGYEYNCPPATDPEYDALTYVFSFDTAQVSEPGAGDPQPIVYSWPEAGTFEVKAKAVDRYGFSSDWSDPLTVLIHSFIAGDANNDKAVNIFDITYLITFLYLEGPEPIPYDAGNVNGSGLINIFDITYLISFLYLDGPAPTYPSK